MDNPVKYNVLSPLLVTQVKLLLKEGADPAHQSLTRFTSLEKPESSDGLFSQGYEKRRRLESEPKLQSDPS